MAGRPGRRDFGAIRKRASGRYSVSYVGPDGRRYFAPGTFSTKTDASAWLAKERTAIASETWTSPKVRRARREGVTVAQVYALWIEDRDRPLAPTTAQLYAKHWRTHLQPKFGDALVAAVAAEEVRSWHRTLATGETAKAHALGMLRAMLNYAVKAEFIATNPATGVGATKNARVKDLQPATVAELTVIVANMRTEQMRTMVLVTAWLALRWGEVTELRRKDVDLERGVVRIDRAVSRVAGRWHVGPPKAGSIRVVAIPPHLGATLTAYLDEYVARDPEALLFPSRRDRRAHLSPDAFNTEFHPARAAAGRPDLTAHGLRHTGAVIAAQSGATLIDVMKRLGHTTTAAALRYQHSAEERQRQIAEAMSRLAE